MSSSGRSDRQRVDISRVLKLLTHRHVNKPDYILATFVFSAILHISNAHLGVTTQVIERVSCLILAHLACIGFLKLITAGMKQATMTNRQRASLLLGFLGAAIIRAVVLNGGLLLLGVISADLAYVRSISSLGTITLGYLALSFMFGLKSEWAEQSSKQLALQEQLRTLVEGANRKLEKHIQDDVAKVRATLTVRLEALLNKQPQEIANGLKTILDEVLRPKVAELVSNRAEAFHGEETATRRFSWGQLIAYLSLQSAASPLVISLTIVGVYFPYLILSEGIRQAFLSGMIGAPLLAVGLWLVRMLLATSVDKTPPGVRWFLIAVALALSTAPYALAYSALYPLAGSYEWLPSLALAGVATLGMIIAFSSAANRQLVLLTSQLESDSYRLRWQAAELGGRDWFLQQQFARKLHGPIQAEVAAATIRIEQGISSNKAGGETGETRNQATLIQQELISKLTQLLTSEGSSPNLNEVLAEMRETWEGIAEIEFDVSSSSEGDLAGDQIAVETAIEIIREACSNSIRHGKARNIEVAVTVAGDDAIEIQITDDGQAPAADATPGLGTKYLNECTIENSRQASESGTVLKAVIPVRPSA